MSTTVSNVAVGGTLDVAGATTLAGGLAVTGNITATGDITGSGGNRLQYYFIQADASTQSQSAVALTALGSSVLTGLPAIRAGSVVGIGVTCESARTAGTLTVDATIGGTVTGLQAVLNATNTTTAVATQAKDTDAVAAGNLIGVKVTTSSDWDNSGDTPEIIVVVEIEG